ncbi:MAG: proline reductase [Firmicutes bacterium]|nr:proline reductase [Bacillota bacterium]
MGVSTSTKETTLHYFRDPLLDVVSADRDVDLAGIIIAGTPQDNESKYFLGARVADWAEAMRLEGVIVTLEGWGNDHVDFANTIEELSKRGISVSGLSFVGGEGFVVSNRYMDAIVDFCKSESGYESGLVGENTVDELDARKALAYLKLKMNKRKPEGR